jgi:hypothetical protein
MSGLEIVPDPWVSDNPGAKAAASWLQAHGYDMVAIPVIDLLTVVARLDQIDRQGACPVTLDRLFTCDLPRLRQYLPPKALEELGR